MSLKLQYSQVIEAPGKRAVEMLFAGKPAPEPDEAQIRFVLPVSAEECPRIPKAQLEALRYVRNVIDSEIQRLQRIRDQAYANEDW